MSDGSAVAKAPCVALDITDKDADAGEKVAKVCAVNAGGIQNIADVCKKLDCKMTYISISTVKHLTVKVRSLGSRNTRIISL